MRPIGVSPNANGAAVTIGNDSFHLVTAEVDALVSAIVDARAKLKPAFEVPKEPEPPWVTWHDIATRTLTPDPKDGSGVIFQIVHPAVGWTTFQIPYALAGQLAEALLRHRISR